MHVSFAARTCGPSSIISSRFTSFENLYIKNVPILPEASPMQPIGPIGSEGPIELLLAKVKNASGRIGIFQLENPI